MIRVTAVEPGTIGAELGLEPGSELLSVNGRELDDFLDWEYLTAEENFILHVRQPGGEEVEFDIERPLDEPMGLGSSRPASAGAPTAAISVSSTATRRACVTYSTSATTTTGSVSATATSRRSRT